MKSRQVRNLVIGTIVALLAAVLLTFLNRYSIRERTADMQVRYRLFRLGRAVNFWVDDHSRRSFPKIINPEPRTLWLPGRTGSAGQILADYLGGDIKEQQREDESTEEYHARLRAKELTVDPATGFEFWYNPLMSGADPRQVAASGKSLMYFRTQQNSDGSWPYSQDGVAGAFTVNGSGESRQVSEDELDQLRAEYARLEEQYRDRPEALEPYHRKLRDLERLFSEQGQTVDGKRYVTLHRLQPTIGFLEP